MEKLTSKVAKSEKLTKAASQLNSNPVMAKVGESLKFGAEKLKGADKQKLAAGIGATVGAIYIASVDANEDGVSDIAQKGVNAYKGAISKLALINEALKILS